MVFMPSQVLRKYSDKTVARDFVRELESYAGDPSNLVMSGEPSPQSVISGLIAEPGVNRCVCPLSWLKFIGFFGGW